MAVGLPITKDEINNQAGSLARSLRNVLQTIAEMDEWILTVTLTDMETNWGISQADGLLIKVALQDMHDVAKIWTGVTPVSAPPRDYSASSRILIGVGIF